MDERNRIKRNKLKEQTHEWDNEHQQNKKNEYKKWNKNIRHVRSQIKEKRK